MSQRQPAGRSTNQRRLRDDPM